jgi:hypothetical protein
MLCSTSYRQFRVKVWLRAVERTTSIAAQRRMTLLYQLRSASRKITLRTRPVLWEFQLHWKLITIGIIRSAHFVLYNVLQLVKEGNKTSNNKRNNVRHKRGGTNWNSTKEEKEKRKEQRKKYIKINYINFYFTYTSIADTLAAPHTGSEPIGHFWASLMQYGSQFSISTKEALYKTLFNFLAPAGVSVWSL